MTIHLPSFIFMVELLVAESLFLNIAQKRSYFWLRAIPCTLICLLAGLFCPFHTYDSLVVNSIFNFLRFFLMFVLTCCCAVFCFKGRLPALIALCTAGYAAQHGTQRLYVVLNSFIPLLNDMTNTGLRSGLRALIYFPLPYLLFWLFFARPAQRDNYMEETDKKMQFISIGIVILCMGVSRISDFNTNRTTIATVAESTYAFICSFMILLIQFYFFHYEKEKREVITLNELLRKEQKEFRQRMENAELINIKCHDLKQSISTLRGHCSEGMLKEVEDAVSVYNNATETGNKILDILLYEKGTYCEANQIAFSYMIDGTGLGVLEDMDIYSLFSNIVTNAIEATERIKDENKRAISLSVKQVGETLVIHEENYCSDAIEWKNGLPVSNKGDKNNHGFGMKSMQLIVTRLGGTIFCKAENGVYSLNITIPVPEKEKTITEG